MAHINNMITQSRFACLDIEDDDSGSKQDTKKKNSKITNKKGSATKKSAQLQPSKQQTTVPKKKKPKQEASEQQWEEWKEKDSQLVNGNFEQDMKDAILESILQSEFDSKKNKEKITKSNGEQVDNDKNKKKKKKSVSLHQFLNDSPKKTSEEEISQPLNSYENKFFDDIISGAKQELNKEEVRERRKKNNENVDQLIYQDQLEKEKAKRLALEMEVKSLKEEMKSVKARNKTLCSLLSQGEMKDKVQILKELERLTTMKDELTQEVERLHTELEQERSKSASLTSDSKNQPKKKSKKH